MKRVNVTWEKTVQVTLYVPTDMDKHELLAIAEETADSIDRDGWDAEWETHISRSEDMDLPDAECRFVEKQNRYGHTFRTVVEGSRLASGDVMVLSDERDELVNPEDATWWVAPTEPDAAPGEVGE